MEQLVTIQAVTVACALGTAFAAYMLLFSPGAQLHPFNSSSRLLCVRFGYSPESAYQQIARYEPRERHLYRDHLRVDCVFVLFYSIPVSLLIAYLASVPSSGSSTGTWFAMAPLGAGVVDWVEDAILLRVLGVFPQRSDNLLRAASLVTRVKWVMVAISLLGVVIGLVSVAAHALTAAA